VIAVIVILAVVAGAALYLLVFNKKSEATGPELTVQKYFEALSTGDVAALKSLYTPEAVPPDASLAIIEQLYASGTIKYENLKLETVDETASDAQVRVLDGDLVVTLAGQDQRVKLSEMMAAGVISFKLRQADGNWYVYEGGEMPSINLPSPGDMPSSGT
jgi:ketosteroid isomerase-like protein